MFHEFNEMKYRARRCINGTETQYLYVLLNYIVRAREVILIWSVVFNLTFDVHKKPELLFLFYVLDFNAIFANQDPLPL